MYICYNKLWHLLMDKNMNREDLRRLSGISSASVAKLGKGLNISTDILVRICECLQCDLTDIMELAPDTEGHEYLRKVRPLPRVSPKTDDKLDG